MRTIILTERRSTEVELPEDDLAFLLENHARHLRLEPSRRSGHYRLTPTRLVGVIVGPSCRIVLRPKLPLASLSYLIDSKTPLYLQQGPDTEGAQLLDLLALRLAALLGERVRAGLHLGYVESPGEGPLLEGRLDMARQLRQPEPQPRVFHFQRDEQTVDIACNRAIRGVAERLLASPLLDETSRAALRSSLTGFEGV